MQVGQPYTHPQPWTFWCEDLLKVIGNSNHCRDFKVGRYQNQCRFSTFVHTHTHTIHMHIQMHLYNHSYMCRNYTHVTWQSKKYNNTYTCEYINIYMWSLQSVLNNTVQSMIFFSQNIYIYFFLPFTLSSPIN